MTMPNNPFSERIPYFCSQQLPHDPGEFVLSLHSLLGMLRSENCYPIHPAFLVASYQITHNYSRHGAIALYSKIQWLYSLLASQ